MLDLFNRVLTACIKLLQVINASHENHHSKAITVLISEGAKLKTISQVS